MERNTYNYEIKLKYTLWRESESKKQQIYSKSQLVDIQIEKYWKQSAINACGKGKITEKQ